MFNQFFRIVNLQQLSAAFDLELFTESPSSKFRDVVVSMGGGGHRDGKQRVWRDTLPALWLRQGL